MVVIEVSWRWSGSDTRRTDSDVLLVDENESETKRVDASLNFSQFYMHVRNWTDLVQDDIAKWMF